MRALCPPVTGEGALQGSEGRSADPMAGVGCRNAGKTNYSSMSAAQFSSPGPLESLARHIMRSPQAKLRYTCATRR